MRRIYDWLAVIIMATLVVGVLLAGEVHVPMTFFREVRLAEWAPTCTISGVTVISPGSFSSSGTWYYALAASNDAGLTAAGPVTNATVATGQAVRISWHKLPATTTYYLYRGADPTTLAEYVTVTTTQYIDWGTNTWLAGGPSSGAIGIPSLILPAGHIPRDDNAAMPRQWIEERETNLSALLRWQTWTEEITDTISNRAAATGWDTNTMDLLVDDTNGVYFPWNGSVTQRWVKWNTNCWLATSNITCLSVWNSTGHNSRAGTLITHKHFINASHYALATGDHIVWMDWSNTPWTGIVSKSTSLGDDVQLYELESEAPSNIAVARLWNDEFYKWIPRGMSGTWAVVVDSYKRAGIAEMTDWNKAFQSNADFGPFYLLLGSGSSGHPAFALASDGTLHLQFCFTSGTGGDCALIHKYTCIISQLQAWGATDLPDFYNAIHRRNPIPLSPQWFDAQDDFPADGDEYCLATRDGSNWLWRRTWSELYATRDMIVTGFWRGFHVVNTGALTDAIYDNPGMTNGADSWATSGDVDRIYYPGGGVRVVTNDGTSQGSVWPSNSAELCYAGVYHIRIPMSVSQYADTGSASYTISFGGWATNILIGSDECSEEFPEYAWDGMIDTYVTAYSNADIYITIVVTSASAGVYDCYVEHVTGGTLRVASDMDCGGTLRCPTAHIARAASTALVGRLNAQYLYGHPASYFATSAAATNQRGLSVSDVSGTWTVNYDAGSYQRANITGAVTNVTVTGAAAAEFAELTLVVANPSVYSISWPTSNWYWMEGTAPESTTNGWDIYSLWTYSNVTWIGRAGGSDQ